LKPSIITLLTDFGTQDYFVAAMKGVILSRNPHAQIIDITHEVPPQNIRAGAFNLLAAYRDFPAGTIHVAVVDPGVGSDRRAIIMECANQFFVAPDNGLLSWIAQREKKCFVYQVTDKTVFRQPVSNTFHGRDIFAPVAAALSTGKTPAELGPLVDSIAQLESLEPKVNDDGRIEGAIIHIDRFGNCITNLTAEHVGGRGADANLKLMVNETLISSVRQFFSDKSGPDGELFMLLGSAGFIEIAARNASAAAILNARSGQSLALTGSIGRGPTAST
jgi:S-adenosylmethionine hydrolase